MRQELQPLGQVVVGTALLLGFGVQFGQAVVGLAQSLLALLTLRLEGAEPLLELLALAAAALATAACDARGSILKKSEKKKRKSKLSFFDLSHV